jgi:hypothetical protein
MITRAGVVAGLAVGCVALPAVGGVPVVHAAVAGSSSYVPVGPVRLVDTRENKGFTRTAATTLDVPVAGVGGVPKGAVAVSLSVAVTNTKSAGYVTVWPAGESMPLASNVNFEAGQIVSNGLIVKLGDAGKLSIYSNVPVDIVVDVTGAFIPAAASKAGRFVATDPVRLLDSRVGEPMPAGGLVRVALPATAPRDAVAAAVTLTTSGDNEPGFFTAFGAGSVPWSSSLNVDTPDSTRAATVVVPVSGGGLSVFSSSGGHMIVDFLGYFTGASAASSENGLFVPMTPKRLVDTRDAITLDATETLLVPATGGVVVGNVTMTEAARPGFSVVYAAGTPLPATSSVNAMRAGQTVSNMAISRASSAGVAIYSQQGSDYVFDQTGSFTGAPVAQTVPLPKAPVGPKPPPTPFTPAPEPPTGPGCSVSSLLVPVCGAWLGASTPSKAGLRTSEGYATGLNEYEQAAQNVPDILHFYKNGGQVFPNAQEIAMSQRSGKQRSLLFYNWKPNPNMNWRQIADGGADSEIQAVANGLKKYNHKLFLTIWHEPENDAGGAGRTPADYVAMYRYTVTKLRSLGVTNVVFVMNYMGFFGWADMFDGLYPGDDVVDWIAYDPYGLSGHNDFGMFLDTKKQGFEGFYTWATNKAPGKPIMLAEWGFNLPETPNAPAILDGAVPIMQSRFPAVKALVYWHDDLGNFKVRLDQSSALGQAYTAAYSRFANNAYFNSTSTAAAP